MSTVEALVTTACAEAEARQRRAPRVAVVIPCFRGSGTVCEVIRLIGPAVGHIYLVDDGCPEASGDHVARECADPRVEVLYNRRNLGVGGAMKRGYCEALEAGAEIVVKVDADGQMDPAFIPALIEPIVSGRAAYAKGNRFAGGTRGMPPLRRLGNLVYSQLHKPVTGCWRIGDPANGYTAIDRVALERIDLDAVTDCYFFETDLLFQLNLAGASVEEVPIPAYYGAEVSSLRLRDVLPRFPRFAASRMLRRRRRSRRSGRGAAVARPLFVQESGR